MSCLCSCRRGVFAPALAAFTALYLAPSVSSAVEAASPAPVAPLVSAGASDQAFVPAEAVATLCLRPNELLNGPQLKLLAGVLGAGQGLLPVPITLIDQFTAVYIRLSKEHPTRDTSLVFDLNIVRTRKAIDWPKRVARNETPLSPVEYHGTTYYRVNDSAEICFWPADPWHFIGANEYCIRLAIDRGSAPMPADLPWTDSWETAAKSPLILAFEPTWLLGEAKSKLGGQDDLKIALSAAQGLLKDTRAILGHVEADGQLRLTGTLVCNDEAIAKKKVGSVKAAVGLIKQFTRAPANRGGGNNASFEGQLLKMLEKPEVSPAGKTVQIRLTGEGTAGEAVYLLAQGMSRVFDFNFNSASLLVGPAAGPAAPVVPANVLELPEIAAGRQKSLDNLTKVAAALVRYRADNGALPPRALMSADGRALLSWRVALLPYLGYDELYAQFHLNERWDSPHNAALLAKIPREFADPWRWNETAPPTDSVIYAAVGPQAAFTPAGSRPTGDPRSLPMLIETHGGMAWTCPGDIDVTQPGQTLGGVQPGRVCLATLDGAVKAQPLDALAALFNWPAVPAPPVTMQPVTISLEVLGLDVQ